MSWILCRDDGYLLQCDRCGYVRGSRYKTDRERTRVNGMRTFGVQCAPDTWLTTPEEDHICPDCNGKRAAARLFKRLQYPRPPDKHNPLDARGILPWQPGDEPAEVAIRRIRGG